MKQKIGSKRHVIELGKKNQETNLINIQDTYNCSSLLNQDNPIYTCYWMEEETFGRSSKWCSQWKDIPKVISKIFSQIRFTT